MRLHSRPRRRPGTPKEQPRLVLAEPQPDDTPAVARHRSAVASSPWAWLVREVGVLLPPRREAGEGERQVT
jgi:hypothetical protein